MAKPNAAGKKKCSAGTWDVKRTLWNLGISAQKIAMPRAKTMAGKRRRFCVRLLKAGGCWKIERRRVGLP
jgi:hypothetical protein